MKIKDIKPNPDNPRLIKDHKFKKLVKSISEFPKMMELRPIVVDGDGMVLGGNMRLNALKELKYKDIPDTWVKQADELTDEEKKRFIIADNVGFGDWDWDLIANEWDAEQLTEWGLDLPLFEEPQDYSDKNKEIDVNEFEDKMTIKLEFTADDYFKVQEALKDAGVTAENALYKYLFPDEQTPF